jgi:hypothetical protein
MAAYLTAEQVYGHLSETLTVAATSRLGVDIDTVIAAATAHVQQLVHSCGFSAPSTTDDPWLQSATLAALWELLANKPKAGVKLPDGWATDPGRMKLAALEDRSASLHLEAIGLSCNTATSVGGSQWTDTSSTSDNPARTSRDELAGY